ncbi:ABC transporter ATP-binding protein [Nanchangia anserum]|uniref:ABC transporter ATP-binding protein n=1 Tax=Nanchangia anserum TaxID=2692125 RepID=A0A8I0KPT7_9ACTO|nr:ABC transporter ATP-binding protein [Nanchangia anserum]MBD3689240.1 ABC transporter ATP-binding protein [Nanchangia anserum]QOX81462.1 ABC transporter ATP-binding protein [Nanchangia anserum]
MEPVVALTNVRFAYGKHEVLEGVSLDVAEGELVVLLGPNGAGKSTLIEQIVGTKRPHAGTVRVLGADPARPDDAWLGRIGVVAQHSRDRGMWNLRMFLSWVGAHYRALGRDVLSPEVAADRVGLGDQLTQRLGQLSGGERRRADLAAALIGVPDLLVLDEPTTGLDPVVKAQVHDVLADEIDRGATIVMTSHDMGEAQRIAQRVVVLSSGRILFDGTPARLRERVGAHAEVTWVDQERRYVHATADPEAFIRSLDLSQVRNLEVTRPNLEDAYIDLLSRQGDDHE